VKPKILFFLVPSAILVGFGIWIIGFNIVNYLHQIEQIDSSKQFCNGIQCVCNNFGCTTKNDLAIPYASYFSWGTGFVSLGVIILVFSRRWWK